MIGPEVLVSGIPARGHPPNPDVVQLGQKGVHVAGNPGDQGDQLSVRATEVRSVLLHNQFRKPPINPLQPEDGDEVCMRAGQDISGVTRRELVRRDIGTCEMLDKMVTDPLVEDVVIFSRGPTDVRILHEGGGCQLFIIGHIDCLFDALPAIGVKEFPGQKRVREE